MVVILQIDKQLTMPGALVFRRRGLPVSVIGFQHILILLRHIERSALKGKPDPLCRVEQLCGDQHGIRCARRVKAAEGPVTVPGIQQQQTLRTAGQQTAEGRAVQTTLYPERSNSGERIEGS